MDTYKLTGKKVEIGLPARLDVAKTAEMLGFEPHDIPILVSKGLLHPLGKPAQNARKYFARVDILQLAEDAVWLNRATSALYRHWQEQNAKRITGEQCPAGTI